METARRALGRTAQLARAFPAGAMVSVPRGTATPDDEPLRAGLRYAQLNAAPAEAAMLGGDTVDEIVAYADSIDAD